jgi:hypothetical protein
MREFKGEGNVTSQFGANQLEYKEKIFTDLYVSGIN